MIRGILAPALSLTLVCCAENRGRGQAPSPPLSVVVKPQSQTKPQRKPEPPPAARKNPGDIEGKRISEVQIRYVGDTTVDEARLRGLIGTQVGGSYSSERADTDIKDLYQSGYIDDVRVLAEPTDDGMRVIYEVTTRPPMRRPPFVGNTAFSDERLAKETKLAVGQKITPDALAGARQNLEDYYHAHGYSRAKIELAWDGEDFSFQIEEGPKTRP